MESVGQELLFHIQRSIEIMEQLGEDIHLKFGHMSIGSKKSIWMDKETADSLVNQLVESGFSHEKTDRESYRIERELFVPGTRFRIGIQHRPTKQDEMEILQEQAEAAQMKLQLMKEKMEKGGATA
jgi:DNA-binding IclR family transcriptional regulator